MKIFISWSPVPPDPPYWKWMPVDGIVVSVGLLKKKRLLHRTSLTGLHEFLGFRGKIFLDSGSYEDSITDMELSPRSPQELMFVAKWLRVDYVAHLDTPFVGRNLQMTEEKKWQLLGRNILNARVAFESSRNAKNCPQTVYVIQGWNHESLTFCAQELAKLNARYYGIGSLRGLQPEEIQMRVRLVRSAIGYQPKLHLFAVSSPAIIRAVKDTVDSVDASTPGISGAMKEVFLNGGKRRHIDRVRSVPRCQCPVCQDKKGAILLLGKRGYQNYYNKLRKLHNAFQLLSSIRQSLEL